jgi:hypothetical protein
MSWSSTIPQPYPGLVLARRLVGISQIDQRQIGSTARKDRLLPNRATAEEAIKIIDRRLPAEMMSLPRRTFARALLTEAIQTGKSRDVNAAVRQLTQALRNEHWLDEVAAG